METATLVAISISGLLVSFTGYALYTAFGQPSQQLRDPFEEHGDYASLEVDFENRILSTALDSDKARAREICLN